MWRRKTSNVTVVINKNLGYGYNVCVFTNWISYIEMHTFLQIFICIYIFDFLNVFIKTLIHCNHRFYHVIFQKYITSYCNCKGKRKRLQKEENHAVKYLYIVKKCTLIWRVFRYKQHILPSAYSLGYKNRSSYSIITPVLLLTAFITFRPNAQFVCCSAFLCDETRFTFTYVIMNNYISFVFHWKCIANAFSIW